MLKSEGQTLLAPGIGNRILFFKNYSAIPVYVIVENLDDALSAAIHYESSNDGTTWSTIVGTSKSIPPNQSDGQIIQSSSRDLALFAQGNVQLLITVIRVHNGDNPNLN
jgi:hypothetical protein